MKKANFLVQTNSWFMRTIALVAVAVFGFTATMPAYADDEFPTVAIDLPSTGTLTVNKVLIGGQDDTFSFSGTGSIGDFNITTTGGSGSQSFQGLSTADSFTVNENSLPAGWEVTGNTCVEISVNVDGTSCTITNTYTPPTPTYSISGKVYNDNNSQNGQFDEGSESGLQNWTVYLDADNSDTLNGEELSTTSDSSGDYAFNGLAAGCYTVREVLQSDWNQTQPTEAQDFEYQVSIGGSTFCNVVSFLGKVESMFIHTAEAAVILDARNLNFGNVEQSNGGGSSSGSGKRTPPTTTTSDGGGTPGRVLGDVTTVPSEPGATLPVTGTSTWVLLVAAILAVPLYYGQKLVVRKN